MKKKIDTTLSLCLPDQCKKKKKKCFMEPISCLGTEAWQKLMFPPGDSKPTVKPQLCWFYFCCVIVLFSKPERGCKPSWIYSPTFGNMYSTWLLKNLSQVQDAFLVLLAVRNSKWKRDSRFHHVSPLYMCCLCLRKLSCQVSATEFKIHKYNYKCWTVPWEVS